MTQWIKCPSCNGEIGTPPTLSQPVVVCPNCSTKVDVESAVAWRPSRAEAKDDPDAGRPSPSVAAKERPELDGPFAIRKSAPEWYTPAGVIAVVTGVAGFIASAAVGGGRQIEDKMLAGALNPLFFVGVPLGIYWLYARLSRENANNFYCPHCDAGICLDCPRGGVVGCWRCGKKMVKP